MKSKKTSKKTPVRSKKQPKKQVKASQKTKGWSLKEFWRSRYTWQKTVLGVVALCGLFLLTIYLAAVVYRFAHRNDPLQYGVTFIPNYARYLGVEPEETMIALRDDLGFRRFRLVSYWSSIEKAPGEYDFSELDWQFEKVAEVNGEVTLAIGIRQPRWPECHIPEMYHGQNIDELYPKLEKFMSAVVDRYKNHPSLESYQLENEFFLKVFGECPDFSRERLEKEYKLVKSIDSDTPIILSLANNYWGVPTGDPRPDIFGVSVYKRVFDYTITKDYFEYPFPSWYYTGRAGLKQLLTGRKTMLHELQAEPWAPVGMVDASIEEQNKSMDAKRLKERIEYGKNTGFHKIDLWGGEWWYWRMKQHNDPSLWETVRNEIQPENL